MTQSQPAAEEQQGPPLPKWAYKIVNPLLMTILRSPLHKPISNSLMILMFEGRKSGKRYMIPVGYVAEGNRLYVFSHSAWAKNFREAAPVAMRLRGKLIRGTACITEDSAVIDTVVGRMIAERGEEMAQRMGFVRNSDPKSTRQYAPKNTTFVEIELDEPLPE